MSGPFEIKSVVLKPFADQGSTNSDFQPLSGIVDDGPDDTEPIVEDYTPAAINNTLPARIIAKPPGSLATFISNMFIKKTAPALMITEINLANTLKSNFVAKFAIYKNDRVTYSADLSDAEAIASGSVNEIKTNTDMQKLVMNAYFAGKYPTMSPLLGSLIKEFNSSLIDLNTLKSNIIADFKAQNQLEADVKDAHDNAATSPKYYDAFAGLTFLNDHKNDMDSLILNLRDAVKELKQIVQNCANSKDKLLNEMETTAATEIKQFESKYSDLNDLFKKLINIHAGFYNLSLDANFKAELQGANRQNFNNLLLNCYNGELTLYDQKSNKGYLVDYKTTLANCNALLMDIKSQFNNIYLNPARFNKAIFEKQIRSKLNKAFEDLKLIIESGSAFAALEANIQANVTQVVRDLMLVSKIVRDVSLSLITNKAQSCAGLTADIALIGDAQTQFDAKNLDQQAQNIENAAKALHAKIEADEKQQISNINIAIAAYNAAKTQLNYNAVETEKQKLYSLLAQKVFQQEINDIASIESQLQQKKSSIQPQQQPQQQSAQQAQSNPAQPQPAQSQQPNVQQAQSAQQSAQQPQQPQQPQSQQPNVQQAQSAQVQSNPAQPQPIQSQQPNPAQPQQAQSQQPQQPQPAQSQQPNVQQAQPNPAQVQSNPAQQVQQNQPAQQQPAQSQQPQQPQQPNVQQAQSQQPNVQQAQSAQAQPNPVQQPQQAPQPQPAQVQQNQPAQPQQTIEQQAQKVLDDMRKFKAYLENKIQSEIKIIADEKDKLQKSVIKPLNQNAAQTLTEAQQKALVNINTARNLVKRNISDFEEMLKEIDSKISEVEQQVKDIQSADINKASVIMQKLSAINLKTYKDDAKSYYDGAKQQLDQLKNLIGKFDTIPPKATPQPSLAQNPVQQNPVQQNASPVQPQLSSANYLKPSAAKPAAPRKSS